nr:MAG TPA: hypothetical protein [Bacteriophage sp.]
MKILISLDIKMLIFVYTSTNFYNIVIQIKDLYVLHFILYQSYFLFLFSIFFITLIRNKI